MIRRNPFWECISFKPKYKIGPKMILGRGSDCGYLVALQPVSESSYLVRCHGAHYNRKGHTAP